MPLFELEQTGIDDFFNDEIFIEDAVQKIIGTKLSDENILDYVLQEPQQFTNFSDNDESEKEIKIPNQEGLLNGLNKYFEYFKNTNCHKEVEYLHHIKRKLEEHLNFE